MVNSDSTLAPDSSALTTINGHANGESIVPAPAVKFRIGRDTLNAAVAGLPDEHREALTWLWSFCSSRNLTKERMGALVTKVNGRGHYSYDSLYQALTGRRTEADSNLEPLCRAIQAFRRSVEPARESREGFIETRLAREIWAYARKAQQQGKIGFIFGKMTIGKSDALAELARLDPQFTYTRMPTRGHLAHYVQECARKLAMGDQQTVLDLRHRIISSFAPGRALIVDEADQCFASLRHTLGLSTLDFIRELWDSARCGILLVMDDAGRDAMLRGPHAKRLGRLWRRRLATFNLPRVPYAEDLDLFAARYGLSPATDEKIKVRVPFFEDGEERYREHTDSPARLQSDVVSSDHGGLTVWLSLLEEAREMAKASRRPITWGAVIKAHCEFQAAEFSGMEVAS